MIEPIDYPTVEIAGEKLCVKFDLHAQLLLSRQGLDTAKPPAPGDPAYLDYRLKCWAAAVDNNYPAGQAPTPDEWAKRAGLKEWIKLDQALSVAMGKAAAELREGIRAVAPPEKALAS
jgi:hypothetical protein